MFHKSDSVAPSEDWPRKKKRHKTHASDIDGLKAEAADEEEVEDDDDDQDWVDHDTASLATIDSDRLHASRPNRWRGATRQWQRLTEMDRAVVSGLHRTRDGDLAAHLYNAFQVKRRIDEEEEAKGGKQEPAWRPKPYWTAWPLRVRFNPGVFARSQRRKHYSQQQQQPEKRDRHGCSRRQRGSGNPFDGPSGPLAEMVTATILRVAREQFQRRQATTEKATATKTSLVLSADDALSEAILQPTVRHMLAQVDKVLLFLHRTRAATPVAKESWYTSQRQKRAWYRQSIEQSGTAASRVIMQRLPAPSKRQTAWWPEDESEEEEEEEEEEENNDDEDTDDDDDDEDDEDDDKDIDDKEEERRKQTSIPPRVTEIKPPYVPHSLPGRAPSHASPVPSVAARPGPAPSTQPAPKQGRRPGKDAARRPDETEAQFLVRRARSGHRRIPDVASVASVTSVTPVTSATSASASPAPSNGDVTAALWETVLNKHSRLEAKLAAQRTVPAAVVANTPTPTTTTTTTTTAPTAPTAPAATATTDTDRRGKTMARWALRDWTDVVSAAALSGAFDEQVLARTAQRCADLFGQSMALATMEMPARGDTAVRRAVYGPGGEASAASGVSGKLTGKIPEKKQLDADVIVRRAWRQRRQRLARREAVMAASIPEKNDNIIIETARTETAALTVPAPPTPTPPRTIAVVRRQATDQAAIFYCPRPACDRAVEGFARRQNAVRHLKLVHGLVANAADVTLPRVAEQRDE